ARTYSIEAKQRPQKLGAASAHQPGDAQDFSTAQFKRNMAGRASALEFVHGEDHVARLVRHLGKQFLNAAADHQRYDLFLGDIGQAARASQGAVAKYRVAVAEFPNLFQKVADVDDAEPIGL